MRTLQVLMAFICAAASACRAEVGVRIYNLARQPASTVTAATAVAERVFGESGVKVNWTDGDPNDPDAHTVRYGAKMTCPAAALPAQVRVRLVSNTPASVPTFVLGVAYPCSESAIQVTIFSDHVAALTRQLRAPTATILGYAIVHEIGHVLLRSNHHSLEGIMKERWGKSDWNAALSRRLRFTDLQVVQMQFSLSQSLDLAYDTPPSN